MRERPFVFYLSYFARVVQFHDVHMYLRMDKYEVQWHRGFHTYQVGRFLRVQIAACNGLGKEVVKCYHQVCCQQVLLASAVSAVSYSG